MSKERTGKSCLGCGVGWAQLTCPPSTLGCLQEQRVGWIPEGRLERVENYASCLSAAPVKWWPCKEEEKEEDIGTFVSE